MKSLKMSQITVAAAIVVALLFAWTAAVPAQISSNSAQLVGGMPCTCNNTTSGGTCLKASPTATCNSYYNVGDGIGNMTPHYQDYCERVAGCSVTSGSECY